MHARANRRGGGHLPFPEVRRARAPRRSVVAVADALLIFDPGAPPRLRNAEPSEGDRMGQSKIKTDRKPLRSPPIDQSITLSKYAKKLILLPIFAVRSLNLLCNKFILKSFKLKLDQRSNPAKRSLCIRITA